MNEKNNNIKRNGLMKEIEIKIKIVTPIIKAITVKQNKSNT